ncbi:GNAT family N-acetyltransferase [Billgrantia ethanolica]|uniref:GNAT family N-acetyltransferase n=1 Tax=Billgrantia ethanolica TaxID=2733486 RepID=A0ABS9A6X6_9GAMM|nr:GNAT family N-acetyltransferase [Halomonas ethanolica]MCE8004103.1 GNAT family N-acetyltransferase [Halomonas ethanolica]
MLIKQAPSAEAPLQLLLEADPSLDAIARYLEHSICHVATIAEKTVGAYVIQPIGGGVHELMNIAVDPAYQRKGIGKRLLDHAIATVRDAGARRLELCTGTFGYQLSFYQRAGFRVVAVERDYFLTHYDEPIYENGIQHKDRLRLALDY